MNKKDFVIKNVYLSRSNFSIEWGDNHRSYFNYLWLRDNCPSNIHQITRQKTFNIKDVSENIKPLKFSVNKKGNLEIKWNEGNHHSIYEASWLKKHCYSKINDKKYQASYNLWQSNFKKKLIKIYFDHDEIIKKDKILKKWLECLIKYGVTVIKNAPLKKNSAFRILNRISHIRETFFKTPFEVVNIPKPNNAAYTSEKLFNHTDLPYFEYVPGYQFLHCLSNDAQGGLSSIVDGFAIAEYLRKKDLKSFQILTNTEVKFEDNDYTQDKIRIINSPIIKINKYNYLSEIRFNISTTGVLDINPKKIKKFYLAYRKFSTLVHNKNFCINLKLKKGNIICFNNRRILHGRTSFDPNSGYRHLQGYYMDHDEIVGRLNALKKIKV